jgi:phospholipase/carboxylesterase
MALNGVPHSPTQNRSGGSEASVVLWHEAKVVLPTRVFHPPDFDSEREHTLIIGFHGYGASAEGFGRTAQALADMGFLVALPESGYPVLAERELGFQWFPSIEDAELGHQLPNLLFFDRIPALLADLRTRYSIDRAYTLGFSEGAVAAMGSAIFLHEDFAGAVHFGLPEFSSDWLPGQSLPEGKNVRLLFLHGDEDQRVPLSISEKTQSFFSDAGYEATLHPFSGGHTVPRDQLEVVADWIWQ